MATDDETPEFDLLMGQIRASQQDASIYFPVLCKSLVAALGPAVELRSIGRGRRRHDELVVHLGDQEFRTSLERGSVECTTRLVVRGVALSSTPRSLPEWLDALVVALREEAGRSESARTALERLLS